jgi:predicted nucleic acid-binding protein
MTMMTHTGWKIYLDTCSLQRPLDTKTHIRIVLEAEAVLGVIALCEAGKIDLVASEVLAFESSRNPQAERREYALEVLSRASLFVEVNDTIESRARELHQMGMKPLDALHLASAEAAGADFFCTCDDQLLRRAKAVRDLKTIAVSPLELIREIEE